MKSKLTMRNAKSFAQVAASDNYERIARRSLQDIVIFYQAVKTEMQRMLADKSKGIPYDVEVLDRMSVVENQYKRVVTGFLELDDKSQHHALITFSDVVQDLIKCIHMRRTA